jgi:hypothetical protein
MRESDLDFETFIRTGHGSTTRPELELRAAREAGAAPVLARIHLHRAGDVQRHIRPAVRRAALAAQAPWQISQETPETSPVLVGTLSRRSGYHRRLLLLLTSRGKTWGPEPRPRVVAHQDPLAQLKNL